MIEYRSCVMKNPGFMPVLIYKNICKEVKKMRKGIHPDYYQAKVVCNCGNEFVTGSTKEEIHVEVCSKCHPFYTQVSRKQSKLVVESICLIRSMAFRPTNKDYDSLRLFSIISSCFF